MTRLILLIFLLGSSLPLLAESSALALLAANGDRFSIQRLDSGEVWASFFISDQMIASFASHELIVLQIDQHKPVKLEQGFRSCGAPALPPQQISYQFEQDTADSAWIFEGTSRPQQPVLKLLGWDHASYDKINADRRAEVVDFPLSRDHALVSQLGVAKQISFRYATDRGEQREALFSLEPHQQVIQQILMP
ncbi:hypothetical protein [Methylophaga sp. OBS4]|uniref:hypothetical protein n=1 Tax=Methylophaga sp. OBS4 TaxID=2991935 RepID=UPI002256328E|nr:hypothetical protein [Methylophaga sp. OBS4]MCX4186414.1 hypothetical protein [Methylophaga sp. OBS4]